MSATKTTTSSIKTFTREEWMAEGTKRFGEAFDDWAFVCPICKNVAKVGDFRPFADKGSTPNSATNECIGRYTGGGSALGSGGSRTRKPCDYAGYGLFRLSPVCVKTEDGKEIHSFAFAEVTA